MRLILFFLLTILPSLCVIAQPKPGDVFREYIWIPDMVQSEGGKFLRVGGKLDYKINFDHLPEDRQINGYIPLPQYLDLDKAVKAEMQIEKVGSHEDTKNLRVSINKHPSIVFPAAKGIPEPDADYMHHTYPIAPIPLQQLKEGVENTFRFDVDATQKWNWPQNIIYGIVIRVYYKSDKLNIKPVLGGLADGSALTEKQELKLEDPNQNIRQVDYIGKYEDLNYEGDGIYNQWHYHYFRGKIKNHIGTSDAYPYSIVWNTSWVSDQEDIQVAARVVANSGLIYFTQPINGLHFDRSYHVELGKPYDQPKNWVTRSGEFESKIDLKTDPKDIEEAKFYWVSWSPCYANGIYINDHKVFDKEGPCYEYMNHEVDLDDPMILQQGTNIIKTALEPLHDGQMVHGMEVQWPGIMLKVRTRKPASFKASVSDYEGRSHFMVETAKVTYYYDIKGGGFSRMIDSEGKDWINFKMKPWGEYPAAAASSFRGLPNMIFQDADDGAGHPGHNKCTSWIEEEKIVTESLSGKWRWEWTFYDDYVVLDVVKTDRDRAFWFLYEGTPGGSFDPDNTYFGSDAMGPRKLTHDYFKGDIYREKISWMFTGSNSASNTLYLIHKTKDDHPDMIGLLGNSKEGLESEDGMTVFGFGRGEGVDRFLNGRNTFIIGLYPEKVDNDEQYQGLSEFIEQKLRK